MRFTADQRFAHHSPDEVARAFADPGLFAAYPNGDRLARPELVHHEVTGDVVDLHLRYRFVGQLSSAVRAVVDPARLSWVERSRHDLSTCTTTFELAPDHYADRLRCAGTVRVVAAADGSQRLVSGDLKVRVALMGGTVERTIVGDLQQHLRDEVPFVEDYLAATPG